MRQTALPAARTRLLIALALLPAAPRAQTAHWRHLADFTDTRGMVAADGLLATASTRGGVICDPAGGTWEHLSLPQGMLAVELADVCTDGAGTLFWAGGDASLSARGLHDGAWSRGFMEFKEHPQIHEIHDLWGAGGHVLVSHTTGLTCFDYLAEDDEFLVRWNLHALGSFAQQPVLAAAALGDLLVAATPGGFAWGSGYPGQPAVFDNWSNPGGIGAIDRAWLAVGADRVYALISNPQGLSWAGSLDAAGVWRQEYAGISGAQALAADGAHWALALANGDGAMLHIDASAQMVALPQPVGALAWTGEVLWAALLPGANGGGLARVDPDGSVSFLRPDLPGADEFVDLDLAPDGSLWAVGVAADANRNGLYRLDGAALDAPGGNVRQDSAPRLWQAWRLGGNCFGNAPTSVECDQHGGVWYGGWGNGCGRLWPPDSSVTRFSHDASRAHRMRGFGNAQIGSDSTFALVSDLAEDEAGNIWIVNHQALDDSCLVVVPAAWYADSSVAFARHLYSQDGLRFPLRVEPTATLGVWAGVAGKDSRDEDKRLLQLSSRGLPVERLREWRLDEHELSSAAWNFGFASPGSVSGLAGDAGGNLWIATSDGFYMGGLYGGTAQFSRVQFLEGLLSEQLSAVDLDGRGRVWLGSELGLNVYEPQGALFREPSVATELNALLRLPEGFQLHKLLVDRRRGALWVASNLGLFTCATGARDYGAAPRGEARLYPNPFRPDGTARARLLPAGLANDAEVTLYDLNGRRVRSLSLLEAEDGWDGRDERGRLVGSGVYLVLVTSAGGKAEGKVAVIR